MTRFLFHWAAGWTLCLVAGCLFHSSLPTAPPPAEPSRQPVTPPPDPPPPTPSSYSPRPAPPPVAEKPPPPPKVEIQPMRLETPPLPPSPVPAPPEPAVVTALRCLIQKQPREARLALQDLPTAERDEVLALLRLSAGLGERTLDQLSDADLTALLARLQRLDRKLRQRLALSLPRICFCRRIHQFGRYDPLPDDPAFAAGAGGRPGERVQVYAEVRNFTSRRISPDSHETILASALEIRDFQAGGGGHRLVTMNLGQCADRSRTERRDYFLNFQFHIPPRLPPGRYTLWVTVRDVTPGAATTRAREARRSLDFRVRAPGP